MAINDTYITATTIAEDREAMDFYVGGTQYLRLDSGASGTTNDTYIANIDLAPTSMQFYTNGVQVMSLGVGIGPSGDSYIDLREEPPDAIRFYVEDELVMLMSPEVQ